MGSDTLRLGLFGADTLCLGAAVRDASAGQRRPGIGADTGDAPESPGAPAALRGQRPRPPLGYDHRGRRRPRSPGLREFVDEAGRRPESGEYDADEIGADERVPAVTDQGDSEDRRRGG